MQTNYEKTRVKRLTERCSTLYIILDSIRFDPFQNPSSKTALIDDCELANFYNDELIFNYGVTDHHHNHNYDS